MLVNTSKGQKKIKVIKEKTILELLQKNDVYLEAICGGRGVCGKCRIKILTGRLPVTLKDEKYFTKEELQRGYRLACSAYPHNNLEITIDFCEEDFSIVSRFHKKQKFVNTGMAITEVNLEDVNWHKINSMDLAVKSILQESHHLSYKALKALSKVITSYVKGGNNKLKAPVNLLIKKGIILDAFYNEDVETYGIAIDIGTTTLAFYIVDLKTGEIKGGYSRLNSQRRYGADVITRIQSATSGNLEKLKFSIVKDIIVGIEELLNKTNINNRFIYHITIVGNTTMIHLLLGLSPESLGQFPFTSTTLDLIEYNFQTIFKNNLLDCRVNLFPGIDAYIGADIVAGILYHEMFETEKITILIDIGTNGEIVIGNKDGFLATATAAGPALEGGNISCGTGCIIGAITSIKYVGDTLQYEVMGKEKPIGICGSGIIDIVAEGITHGWIDKTGKLSEKFSNGEIVIYHEEEGNIIKFTQKDIREIQLAKSALRSGIECLMIEYGVNYNEIDKVYLAGGFGSNINMDNAVKIGLIPEELKEKIEISGNSSLGGTVKYLLDKDCKRYLEVIKKKSRGINLSNSVKFNNYFIKNISF